MNENLTSAYKQELHNRIDMISSDLFRHIRKLVSSMKNESGKDIKA